MKRLVPLTAGVAFLLSTGCTNDGQWSVRKALGLEETPHGVVKTPDPKTLPKASNEVAERVELLGQTILAKNTFIGIEPLFTTIGVKESALFHIGPERLVISQGLVEKCQSEAELAAVLCSELGKMVAEKRAAKAVGRDVNPIPDVNFGGNPTFPGGTPVDDARQAELGFHDRKYPRGGNQANAAEAGSSAREFLKMAGYSPAELDRVEPLLKQSDRGEKLRKQLGGSAPPPEWKK